MPWTLSCRHESAIVHADMEQETALHEGEVRILSNGWVVLPTGRLLTPDAVHHRYTETV